MVAALHVTLYDAKIIEMREASADAANNGGLYQ
jgi:hypothetical protein